MTRWRWYHEVLSALMTLLAIGPPIAILYGWEPWRTAEAQQYGSTIGAGTGSCTNQFVRGNNVGSAPTCATVAAADLATGAVTGTKIRMGSDAQGDVLFFNGTDYARLGVGTSGQFLTTNGAGANPTWTTASGVPTLTVVVARALGATGTVDASFSSLTVRVCALIDITGSITVNAITYRANTVTTAGTQKLCVYTANGATKSIDVTTAAPSANSLVTTTVASVALSAGLYYQCIGCATTCNLSMDGSNSQNISGGQNPSGKPAIYGTVTHASGGCDATLGTVTAGGSLIPIFRYDN